jgi:hypothetical protein
MKRTKEYIRSAVNSSIFIIILSLLLYSAAQAQTTATIIQSGWYRIAQNGNTLGGTNGSRAAAHFIVMDRTSSQHQSVEFLAYVNFNQMPSIVVLDNSYYGATHIPIPKIRILTSTAYTGTAIEVYISPIAGYSASESFLIEDNTQSSGWTPINWKQVSTGSGDQDGVSSGFIASVLNLKNLVTGYVTKSGTQTSYDNGNFYISGNILLGKTTQSNSIYKLDINGKARANEIVVNSTGADFVFDSSYRLQPLSSVMEYINHNHHLPNIPSASEMQQEGLPVGENQTRLLQKIEELTLYLAAQQHQINHLNASIDTLKRQNLHSAAQNKILKVIVNRLKKLEIKSEKPHLSTVKSSTL